jgi:uncharacterized protein (DUF1501 family)
MSIFHWTRQTEIAMPSTGPMRRRDFLRGVSVAAVAAGFAGWTDLVALRADELKKRGKACILLWMEGGPSQFETFSPKPDHNNGGETKAIATSVPGIQIAENLPKLAQQMNDLAIIRSVTSKEGSHPRAQQFLHTGYLPNPSVRYPTLGSLVTQALAEKETELPAFARIGGRFRTAGGGGILGTAFDPFEISNPEKPPVYTKPNGGRERYKQRLDLLARLEAKDHQALYGKTARMILSPSMKTFDLAQEPEKVRSAYGETRFGASCLLARRLIEAGVTFVEVGLGGWDTHQDNFEACRRQTATIDQPIAQLLTDLRERGMLDSTLVIWMGEFGRTPNINVRVGRDHFPRAFNVALAGAGIRGGQVIGATDASGYEVVDSPVKVPDLFQTFCQALDIDANTENISSQGRPIKIVDGGAPVTALF